MGDREGFSQSRSASRPPEDPDEAREQLVLQFIDLWARGIYEAGVPLDRIYSHTWFIPRRVYEVHKAQQPGLVTISYSQLLNFAPPEVAFGNFSNPGYSTYPALGLFEELHGVVTFRQAPRWASSEGGNLVPEEGVGSSGMTMETYLAKMFNHGAGLVNLFGWGVGGEQSKSMKFRIASEGPEAILAYRKFLRGLTLVDDSSQNGQ